jgi:hypothetical protein
VEVAREIGNSSPGTKRRIVAPVQRGELVARVQVGERRTSSPGIGGRKLVAPVQVGEN